MRIWLKHKRIEYNLSQQELASKVGVNVTAIGKYELGHRRPSYEIAKKIAEVLDFDWTIFFEDTEENAS